MEYTHRSYKKFDPKDNEVMEETKDEIYETFENKKPGVLSDYY